MPEADEPTVAQKLVGDFAPKLAQLTDDVLFADVWARHELSPRDRSLVTVAALIANGNTEQLSCQGDGEQEPNCRAKYLGRSVYGFVGRRPGRLGQIGEYGIANDPVGVGINEMTATAERREKAGEDEHEHEVVVPAGRGRCFCHPATLPCDDAAAGQKRYGRQRPEPSTDKKHQRQGQVSQRQCRDDIGRNVGGRRMLRVGSVRHLVHREDSQTEGGGRLIRSRSTTMGRFCT